MPIHRRSCRTPFRCRAAHRPGGLTIPECGARPRGHHLGAQDFGAAVSGSALATEDGRRPAGRSTHRDLGPAGGGPKPRAGGELGFGRGAHRDPPEDRPTSGAHPAQPRARGGTGLRPSPGSRARAAEGARDHRARGRATPGLRRRRPQRPAGSCSKSPPAVHRSRRPPGRQRRAVHGPSAERQRAVAAGA